MAILTVSKVIKAYGKVEILSDVSFDLEPGEKAGLVGANGSGKTTIFRIVTGEIEADKGDVNVGRNVAMAYMPQAVALDQDTALLPYVLEARADVPETEREMRRIEDEIHARPADEALLRRLGELQERFNARGGYRLTSDAEKILAGLGFAQDQLAIPVNRLSGGEQTKAALARILLQAPDILLLDEPTNHLDIWATEWLEGYLVRSHAAALIVSHDRYFLDRVAGKVIELSSGRTTVFRGNYAAYVEQRDLARLAQERQYAKQRAHILKEEDFIRRYHYGQRAREARGRQKKLDRVARMQKPEAERAWTLKLQAARDKAEKIVRMRGVAKRFGDRELFRDVDFEIPRGGRIGLIGPNGAGKTTFLRVLLGEEPPSEGTVERGKVSVGYYDQQQRSLDDSTTVLGAIGAVHPEWTIKQLRSAAGRFLFSGDDVLKPVEALSGGERARLALAALVLSGPSFLVLDEPTNHLDIPAREAVEDALDGFDGTVLIVTHDRSLLDAVVETLIVIKDGEVRMHIGDYTGWRARMDREAAERAEREEEETGPAASEAHRTAVKERERDRRRRERALAEIHDRIEKLEARHAEIMRAFEDHDTYRDMDRVKSLQGEAEDLSAEIKAAYRDWEALEREERAGN